VNQPTTCLLLTMSTLLTQLIAESSRKQQAEVVDVRWVEAEPRRSATEDKYQVIVYLLAPSWRRRRLQHDKQWICYSLTLTDTVSSIFNWPWHHSILHSVATFNQLNLKLWELMTRFWSYQTCCVFWFQIMYYRFFMPKPQNIKETHNNTTYRKRQ